MPCSLDNHLDLNNNNIILTPTLIILVGEIIRTWGMVLVHNSSRHNNNNHLDNNNTNPPPVNTKLPHSDNNKSSNSLHLHLHNLFHHIKSSKEEGLRKIEGEEESGQQEGPPSTRHQREEEEAEICLCRRENQVQDWKSKLWFDFYSIPLHLFDFNCLCLLVLMCMDLKWSNIPLLG